MCVLIYIFSSYLYIIANNNIEFLGKSNFQKHMATALRKMLTFTFDSFVIISQSTTACLFFLQIKFNKYLAKIICFIGPRTFAVYIIHSNSYINDDIISNLFKDTPSDLTLITVYKLVMVRCLKIFVICIIIDYLRELLFRILRIRKNRL